MRRLAKIGLRGTALAFMFAAGTRAATSSFWPRTAVFMCVYFVVEAMLSFSDYVGTAHGKGKAGR